MQCIDKLFRKRILSKCIDRCAYCGLKSYSMTLDHVIPKYHGGKDESNNLVPCCTICNRAKRNMGLNKFRSKLLHKSGWIEYWNPNLCYRLSARFSDFDGRFYMESHRDYIDLYKYVEQGLLAGKY